MNRLTTLILAGVLLVTVLAGTALAKVRAPLLHHLHHVRDLTWRYQRALVVPLTPYHHSAERSESRAYRRWVLHVWRGRLVRVERRWQRSAVRANLLCIHQGEGSWTAHTGNGYYGGLQMDLAFQRAYGPGFFAAYGTADHWTPLEQLTAGARAVRVRGYSPWPVTGARCGL